VNSDRSVRANKGPERPINPEHERAEVLAALACVDLAVVFDEDTPHALISQVQPDVLVKGADWGEHNIVGRDIVEARGGAWSAWSCAGVFDDEPDRAHPHSRPREPVAFPRCLSPRPLSRCVRSLRARLRGSDSIAPRAPSLA
jgi:hypothetical protein